MLFFASRHCPAAWARLGWLVAAVALLWPASARSAPPVHFELVTERGFPLGGTQQWIEMLSRIGETSIRIRQGQPGDEESIEKGGTDANPAYRVTGVLTAGNRLVLPGGNFGLADRKRLREWIEKLRSEGVDAPTAKTGAFGLTDEQLVEFHEKLATPISCTSVGRRIGDVARDIVQTTSLEFSVSDAARAAFRSADVCDVDLGKLSCGTALAALVRPLGLVIRPEKSSGQIRLRICKAEETEEAWPVGWPPQEIPATTAPTLFERLKVSIKDQPLPVVVSAIQPRVKIPFLFDRQALEQKRIDLDATRVSYAKESESYQRVLTNVFYQAKLTSDLRVDEAGQPFLWITAK